MDEKEVFFATALLMLGPPPTSNFGMAASTMVGSKGQPKIGRPWQISLFAARMVTLAEQVNPALTPKSESEAMDLVVNYYNWFIAQKTMREAVEAL